MIPNEISSGFLTPSGRKKIMKLYGNSQSIFVGINEDGEMVSLSVAPDSMILKTYQSNGWLRVNFYDDEGYPAGESFEGRFDK